LNEQETALSRNVITRWIDVPAADGGRFDAFVALPPAGHGPGLLLLQEIFGVNAHIRGVAQQYAQDGFVVLAPDLFWRQQRRVELGYEGAEREQALAMMKALKPDELAADVRDSVAALRALPEAQGRRAGALGYCLGGRLAYVAAATTDVDAAVAYYGGGIQNQLALAPQVQCPMQFHYAGQDAAIPPDAVQAVQAAMAGRDAEFHLYPEANHGFNCWDRAAYHPASAALAHGRSLQFLAQALFARDTAA
jgi:carboxymethylenebutenolidase